jgi:hypothetical protein
MASSNSQPQLGGQIGYRAVNKRFAFLAALQERFRFEVRKIILCGLVRRAMRILMTDHGVLRRGMLERVLEQCDLAMIEIAAHADLATQIFGSGFLRAHGFVLTWIPSTPAPGTVTVLCRLLHCDGHFDEATLSAPVDTSGNKSPAQGVASTVSLLSRYTALALLGIAALGLALRRQAEEIAALRDLVLRGGDRPTG